MKDSNTSSGWDEDNFEGGVRTQEIDCYLDSRAWSMFDESQALLGGCAAIIENRLITTTNFVSFCKYLFM